MWGSSATILKVQSALRTETSTDKWASRAAVTAKIKGQYSNAMASGWPLSIFSMLYYLYMPVSYNFKS